MKTEIVIPVSMAFNSVQKEGKESRGHEANTKNFLHPRWNTTATW